MTRLLVSALLVCILTACGGAKQNDTEAGGGDTLTCHARLLTMVDAGPYRIADIVNPWDTTQLLQRLILYPRGTTLPDDAPQGVRIATPLTRSVVGSSVHIGAIDELGAIQSVTAVADADYVRTPEVVEGLKSGRVTDVGSSMSPSLEAIVMSAPQAILFTPYQDGGADGVLARAGVPVVKCADWMESTPLGRAEWLLLIGELYGRRDKAEAIFDSVVARYSEIAGRAAKTTNRPKVVTETPINGVWYVPAGESYMARLLTDAGASYPWSDEPGAGSLPLTLEQVFDRASDADFWLVKSYGSDLTLDQLRQTDKRFDRFRAVAHGGVYNCNTAVSPLYEEFPFHPDRLLNDYFLIFHPDRQGTLRYFHHVE